MSSFKIPKKEKLPDIHRRSRQHEGVTAQRLGANLTPRSGAGEIKGDARRLGFARVECKTTKHASFRVTREDVEKLEGHALGFGELPFYVVRLEGPPILEVAVLPVYVLDLIKERLDAKV